MNIKESKIRSVKLSPSETLSILREVASWDQIQNLLLEAFCSELGDGTTPAECSLIESSGVVHICSAAELDGDGSEMDHVAAQAEDYQAVAPSSEPRIQSWIPPLPAIPSIPDIPIPDSADSEPEIQSWGFDESHVDMEDHKGHGLKTGDTVRLDYLDGRDSSTLVVDNTEEDDVWFLADNGLITSYASYYCNSSDSRFNCVRRVTLTERAGE